MAKANMCGKLIRSVDKHLRYLRESLPLDLTFMIINGFMRLSHVELALIDIL